MNETNLLNFARDASGAGVWTLVLIAIITLIKGWPALRKMSLEADGSMRKDLFDRIRELEDELVKERHDCAEKLEELRAEIMGLHRQMVTLQNLHIVDEMPPATAASVRRQAGKDREDNAL